MKAGLNLHSIRNLIKTEEVFLETAQKLKEMGYGKELNSMQGIGYKEVLMHLRGDITLDECKDLIKQSTRRYAKRQVSWFKREQNTVGIDMFCEKKLEIFKKAIDLF